MLSSSGEFYGLPMEVEGEDGHIYVIRPFEASLDKMEKLWDQFGRYSTILADQVKNDKTGFYHWLIQPSTLVLEVDDVGIIYATDIVPGHQARGHYLFWDRRQAGRQRVVLASLKWGMEQFNLHRVRIEIPRFAYSVLRRMYKMQVRLEGVIREERLHEGKWADVFLFGILRDELTDEVVNDARFELDDEAAGWYGVLAQSEELMRLVVRHGRG